MKPQRRNRPTGSKGAQSPGLPVITLLTDFGTADYYVGAMKGAILSVNRNVVIADITHEIPAQDIEAGAFILLTSYKTFPAGTIHVVVVDPGVGSKRRPIIVAAEEQLFVGPDNGIFTALYDRDPSHRTVHITATEFFRPNPSTTFHGRDIFAPVAAALSAGVKLSEFGPVITDEVRLTNLFEPVSQKNAKTQARIIHIDRFGNCVTSISREQFDGRIKSLKVKGKKIRDLRHSYSEARSGKEVFAIWGSAGLLEISVNGASAAKVLGAKRGDSVSLTV